MPTVTDITGNSSTPEQLAVPYGPVRGPQATVALRGTRRDDETIIAMAASWRETAQNHQAAAEAYAQRTMHLQSELTALLDAVRQREAWWRDGVANMANHIGSERHRCVSLEQQAEQEWSEKVLALEHGAHKIRAHCIRSPKNVPRTTRHDAQCRGQCDQAVHRPGR